MSKSKLGLPIPHLEFICLISMLMAVTALSIDAMLPANPQITAEFGVAKPQDLQLIVNAFFLGFALSQLFFGFLSDRFGRKPILLCGLTVFVIASLVAITASSFQALIIARFFQGVGSGAPRIIPTSIIRDLTQGREMAKLISLTMMVFIIVPILAPAAGQLILYFGPWQWIFIMLAVMALGLGLWLTIRLPETLLSTDRQSLKPSAIYANIKIVLTTPNTIGYTLALSCIFGAFNIYLSTSQPVFDQYYGLADNFALIFGFIAVFMGLASFLNARLVVRLGMHRMSHFGLHCFAGLAVIFMISCLVFNGLPPAWLFISLMAGLLFLIGIIFPNQHALAMEPMGEIAGSAASIIGFISTVIGVLLGTVAGQWLHGSLLPMALAFLVYGSLSILIARKTDQMALSRD